MTQTGSSALSSKRLQAIADMVGDHYTHVWDCCCDHGQLGLELLHCRSACVHFVDRVARLTDALEAKLLQVPRVESRWAVHCADVCELQLSDEPNQLLIIAGVGGDTCVEMVERLLARHPQRRLDFIVCPVRQQEQVRAAFGRLSLGLVQESLIQERGRYYEVLFVRQGHVRPVGAVAEDIWQWNNPSHLRYVESRIDYLSRRSIATQDQCKAALESYKTLRERGLQAPPQ